MRIFTIRDEMAQERKDLAYLLYYEIDKRFYIELPDDADEWETPLLLSAFARRGEKTVNSYWSKIWVQQRIVPTDRQNITDILKDNGLKEYDEFELLMLAMGRCAQDDYYLEELTEEELPHAIRCRAKRRIEDVIPLDNYSVLVFFQNGLVKRCKLKAYLESHERYQILLQRKDFFESVRIETGGHGIMWDEILRVSDNYLYHMGVSVPLTMKDFSHFVGARVVNSAEAAAILGCSRQYINELTKKGELHPVKSSEKSTLYLKSELLKRNWQ